MVKFLAFWGEVSRKKFYTLVSLVDILGGILFVVLIGSYLVKNFDVLLSLICLLAIVYILFTMFALFDFLKNPDLRNGLTSIYALIRVILTIIFVIVFIKFILFVADDPGITEAGTVSSNLAWFFYPLMFVLLIGFSLSMYWSFTLMFKVAGKSDLEDVPLNSPNDYYKDNDIFQD